MKFLNFYKKPLFYPIFFAVILHILFALAAMNVYIPGISEITQKATRIFKVKKSEVKSVFTPETANPSFRQLKFLDSNLENQSRILPDVPFKRPSEDSSTPLQKISKFFGNKGFLTQSQERLNSIQEKEFKEEISSQFKFAEDAAALPESFTTKQTHQDLPAYSPPTVAVDPEEGMPGFTPSAFPTKKGFFSFRVDKTIQEPKEVVKKYEPLDDILDIELITYKDPESLEKYFMIRIFTKGSSEGLKVMPKEIIFAIDSSLSISPARLKEIKKGIRDSLSDLNPGDLFNIVTFKDDIEFFSPESVPATARSIKQAERFVSRLTASEQTDVYLAFKSIVQLPLARIPSSIILISDGRPTQGLINSRQVIESVTKINQKTRPIFAFSGGAKVNRYLLDFIAYQNRGWSQFIKKVGDIDKGLVQFYKKIKDPVLINLKYRLNGLDERKVFPKSLPDFYKDTEFTLFGTYSDEEEFSMQLLGKVEGKTKELIFSRSFEEAKQGSRDVMKGYAFNKIYHLISQLSTQGPNPRIQEEVQALSQHYNITTPYSLETRR